MKKRSRAGMDGDMWFIEQMKIKLSDVLPFHMFPAAWLILQPENGWSLL